MRLQNKTALVTGGSRGIGRSCVLELAAEGAEVWFVYYPEADAALNPDTDPAQTLVAEAAEKGGVVHPVEADVRDGKRAQEIVDSIIESHGKIDILINSAGVIRDNLLATMTTDQWQTVIDINLTGTYNYCRAVVQQMCFNRGGSIINISSTSSEFAAGGQVNYAASKGGVNALTRTLAIEVAKRKVRVNAIGPGMIETDMSQAVRNMAGEKTLKKMIPMKRLGQPEDISRVAVFLASDDASYLTGQVIFVDGGLTLGPSYG
jgi:3-oxoacyl-[acyl-carrier protein] reductase